MQEYNIRLKRYNGVDFDTLYPETKTNLLIGQITKSQLANGATYSALQVLLDKDDWDSTTLDQTISVTGVTSTNAVIISPSINDIDLYSDSKILCIAQGDGTLTFQCETIPNDDVYANVLILT